MRLRASKRETMYRQQETIDMLVVQSSHFDDAAWQDQQSPSKACTFHSYQCEKQER